MLNLDYVEYEVCTLNKKIYIDNIRGASVEVEEGRHMFSRREERIENQQ